MNDNIGDRPPAIDELDNLHIGPAPISAVLDAGHAAKRRRRTVLASVAAVAVLLVGGGFVTTQVRSNANTDKPLVSNNDNLTTTAADTAHTITINAVDGPGRRCCYFEGAVEQVRIERVSGTKMIPVRSEIEPAPWSRTWSDLPPGEYTLYAAVRPCGGNCDSLDPPTDTCEDTFQLDADVVVTVAFDYFTACKIDTSTATNASDEEAQTLPVNVERLDPRTPDFEIEPGTARWDPTNETLVYVSRLTYSGSCFPSGRAVMDEGALSLVLTPVTDRPCTADPPRMLASISGLLQPPSEITVTENSEARTVAVVNGGGPAGR